MADHLALMAAHLRLVVERESDMAKAGATLIQARAHLAPGDWNRWVTEDVGVPVERAQQLMAAAEKAGANLELLRPPEL